MKKTTFFLGCCLLAWGATTAIAQEGIVAAGGDATGSGGSSSYSIGQVDYVTASSSGHYIIQGLQQPFELYTGISLNETTAASGTLAYPNPVSKDLTLRIEGQDLEKLSFKMYDDQGRLLMNYRVVSNETVLGIGHLANGNYFIKVFRDNHELTNFKIIKLF